jgi:hypothetical protein
MFIVSTIAIYGFFIYVYFSHLSGAYHFKQDADFVRSALLRDRNTSPFFCL